MVGVVLFRFGQIVADIKEGIPVANLLDGWVVNGVGIPEAFTSTF